MRAESVRLSSHVACVQECPCAWAHRSRTARRPSPESARRPRIRDGDLSSAVSRRARGRRRCRRRPCCRARRRAPRTPAPRSSLTSVPPAASAACDPLLGDVAAAPRCRGGSAAAPRPCASGASWNHSVLLRPPGSLDLGRLASSLVAEHGRPERLDLLGVRDVERELEGRDLARRGLDAELGRDLGDPAGQRDVAAGDAADVVALQVDVDLRVGAGRRRGGGWPPRPPR